MYDSNVREHKMDDTHYSVKNLQALPVCSFSLLKPKNACNLFIFIMGE